MQQFRVLEFHIHDASELYREPEFSIEDSPDVRGELEIKGERGREE